MAPDVSRKVIDMRNGLEDSFVFHKNLFSHVFELILSS